MTYHITIREQNDINTDQYISGDVDTIVKAMVKTARKYRPENHDSVNNTLKKVYGNKYRIQEPKIKGNGGYGFAKNFHQFGWTDIAEFKGHEGYIEKYGDGDENYEKDKWMHYYHEAYREVEELMDAEPTTDEIREIVKNYMHGIEAISAQASKKLYKAKKGHKFADSIEELEAEYEARRKITDKTRAEYQAWKDEGKPVEVLSEEVEIPTNETPDTAEVIKEAVEEVINTPKTKEETKEGDNPFNTRKREPRGAFGALWAA